MGDSYGGDTEWGHQLLQYFTPAKFCLRWLRKWFPTVKDPTGR